MVALDALMSSKDRRSVYMNPDVYEQACRRAEELGLPGFSSYVSWLVSQDLRKSESIGDLGLGRRRREGN